MSRHDPSLKQHCNPQNQPGYQHIKNLLPGTTPRTASKGKTVGNRGPFKGPARRAGAFTKSWISYMEGNANDSEVAVSAPPNHRSSRGGDGWWHPTRSKR